MPVYKRKGSNLDAKSCRGITITPTVAKFLESVIRERIRPINQKPLQRGFTAGSSPMNCSFILEEIIRNNKDSKVPTYIAFLDAKSNFDVVSHTSLLRKVYRLGIEDAIPYALSFRRRFFAYHQAMTHPHSNMILSLFCIPLVLKCAAKILKIGLQINI